MAVVDSFANLECIVNGHRFQAWAAEDPPFDFDYEDAVDTEFGPDGALYAMGMPSLGGTWTFKMFPTSPTAQWAIQQEQIRKESHMSGGEFRFYSGVLSLPAIGTSYRMEGGVIVQFPAVAIPGVTYEGMIRFEKITSNVDGGRFSAPGVSNS